MIEVRFSRSVTATEFIEAFKRAAHRLSWHVEEVKAERYVPGSVQRETTASRLNGKKQVGKALFSKQMVTIFPQPTRGGDNMFPVTWEGEGVFFGIRGPDVRFLFAHGVHDLDYAPKTKHSFEEFLHVLFEELGVAQPRAMTGFPG